MFEKLIDSLKSNHKKNLEQKLKRTPYPKEQKFHYITFKYALDGITWAYKSQPNFKVHLLFFLIAILLTVFLSFYNPLSKVEILIIFLISAIVITAEMVNTALEALSDEVAKGEYKEFIRISKDVSSGAVLMASIFAATIGLIIFLPKVL